MHLLTPITGALEPIQTPDIDWLAIAPEIALAAAGVLIVLARALLRGRPQTMPVCLALAFGGLAAAAAVQVRLWDVVQDDGAIETVAGMVRVDPFAIFLGVVVIIATALGVLLSIAYLRREDLEAPEYLALVMLSGTGMLAMTTANNLIAVFVALEVLSIPLYVLSAFDRRRLSSQESGLKYFVLGAFSSAVFLYGIALDVRRDGHDVDHRDRSVPLAERALRGGHALRRLRAPARRVGLQGRRGAVPHVDARRVPGRPDAGDRFHGRGGEGGRVRRAAADLQRRAAAVLRRLASGGRGARRAFARGRERRRRRADRRETDARVLVDRARRLHPDGLLRRHVAWPRGGTPVPLRVLVHGDRLVRGADARDAPRRRRALARRLSGPRPAPAGARRAAHLLPARAGRHPAHRWVHREARDLRRDRAGR